VTRREAAQHLAPAHQRHARQRRAPRAQTLQQPGIGRRAQRHHGRLQRADKGDDGRAREPVADQRALNHAPGVRRADTPPHEHAAARDNGPAVAAVGGRRVGRERRREYFFLFLGGAAAGDGGGSRTAGGGGGGADGGVGPARGPTDAIGQLD
ncbi:hypothetical protein G3M48_003254, partial [Beauveria asiatica]